MNNVINQLAAMDNSAPAIMRKTAFVIAGHATTQSRPGLSLTAKHGLFLSLAPAKKLKIEKSRAPVTESCFWARSTPCRWSMVFLIIAIGE